VEAVVPDIIIRFTAAHTMAAIIFTITPTTMPH
jgi:hypothetical protein